MARVISEVQGGHIGETIQNPRDNELVRPTPLRPRFLAGAIALLTTIAGCGHPREPDGFDASPRPLTMADIAGVEALAERWPSTRGSAKLSSPTDWTAIHEAVLEHREAWRRAAASSLRPIVIDLSGPERESILTDAVALDALARRTRGFRSAMTTSDAALEGALQDAVVPAALPPMLREWLPAWRARAYTTEAPGGDLPPPPLSLWPRCAVDDAVSAAVVAHQSAWLAAATTDAAERLVLPARRVRAVAAALAAGDDPQAAARETERVYLVEREAPVMRRAREAAAKTIALTAEAVPARESLRQCAQVMDAAMASLLRRAATLPFALTCGGDASEREWAESAARTVIKNACSKWPSDSTAELVRTEAWQLAQAVQRPAGWSEAFVLGYVGGEEQVVNRLRTAVAGDALTIGMDPSLTPIEPVAVEEPEEEEPRPETDPLDVILPPPFERAAWVAVGQSVSAEGANRAWEEIGEAAEARWSEVIERGKRRLQELGKALEAAPENDRVPALRRIIEGLRAVRRELAAADAARFNDARATPGVDLALLARAERRRSLETVLRSAARGSALVWIPLPGSVAAHPALWLHEPDLRLTRQELAIADNIADDMIETTIADAVRVQDVAFERFILSLATLDSRWKPPRIPEAEAVARSNEALAESIAMALPTEVGQRVLARFRHEAWPDTFMGADPDAEDGSHWCADDIRASSLMAVIERVVAGLKGDAPVAPAAKRIVAEAKARLAALSADLQDARAAAPPNPLHGESMNWLRAGRLNPDVEVLSTARVDEAAFAALRLRDLMHHDARAVRRINDALRAAAPESWPFDDPPSSQSGDS